MKRILTLALAGALSLSVLVGCGAEDTGAAALTKLTVGASPTPHSEILQAAKDAMAAKGYDLVIQEFTEYVQPNLALSDGTIDANYFQHEPYLLNFNKNNDTKLVSAGAIHYEPFGIYPGKTKSLDAVPDGATIIVPNDDTNETRALLLLQAQGLITLRDGIDPTVSATAIDIAENPKNLKIQEIESAQLPRSLPDIDLAVINGNYAIQANMSAEKDALAVEDKNSDAAKTYGNIIAVREGEENSEAIKALMEVLTSEEIRTFINDKYAGGVVPLF